MFTLTDDHVKLLIKRSAFIGWFVIPYALASTFPFAYLIFVASRFNLFVKLALIALLFGAFSLLIIFFKNKKVKQISDDVDKIDFIKARLYYADYYGTSTKSKYGKTYYFIVFKDGYGINRTSQINKDEYNRLQTKETRENGVVVLQYLTYDKSKYWYAAYNADTFINKSSIPLEE